MTQHCCDHTCEFHRFKQRAVGEGDTCLLITRDMRTMTETSYMMSQMESAGWCAWFMENNIDQVKFEDLLMQGLTLAQAKEAIS